MGKIMSDQVRILQSDWFDYWHQIALLVEHLIINRHSGDQNLGLVHHYFFPFCSKFLNKISKNQPSVRSPLIESSFLRLWVLLCVWFLFKEASGAFCWFDFLSVIKHCPSDLSYNVKYAGMITDSIIIPNIFKLCSLAFFLYISSHWHNCQ